MTETLQDFEEQKELLRRVKLCSPESQILNKLSEYEWWELLSYMKHKNVPSNDKRMKLNTYGSHKVCERNWCLTNLDKSDPVNTVDANIVNDTLDLIRKGKEGYVYYIRYIELLLKFQPNMAVDYDDGIFYCKIPKYI